VRTFTEFRLNKSTLVLVVLCCLSLILDVSCGGGSSNTPKVSKLAKRAFVVVTSPTNASNVVDILDATKDQFSGFTIPLFGSHATLVQPGASGTTLVFSSGTGDNTISLVDNAKETVSNSAPIQLPGITESMVQSSDAKTIYAAVRSTSQVSVVDVASATLSTNISVPSVRRVVLAHNNSKLLAFSDNLDTFTVINADNTKACGPPDATPPTFPLCGPISRPFYAVFSSDDSKAYVLNCGPECGSGTAGVTIVDMTQNPPTIGATLPVSAATIGLMDSGNLYVAGTDAGGNGHLDIVNLSSFTVSKSIPIGNGFHSLLTLATNNKLFVGSRGCSTGCLSIVDLSAGNAVVDTPAGDVTGIASIPGRNAVYVTEGGELRIFDSTTSKPQNNQLDIVGTVAGVVAP
jgi:hypothetical protein